jgi:hypothetical protein
MTCVLYVHTFNDEFFYGYAPSQGNAFRLLYYFNIGLEGSNENEKHQQRGRGVPNRELNQETIDYEVRTTKY